MKRLFKAQQQDRKKGVLLAEYKKTGKYSKLSTKNSTNIKVGTKLKIWSSRFNSEQIVTVTYRRLNVIFFTYENGEEDWLPTGSYVIETATII